MSRKLVQGTLVLVAALVGLSACDDEGNGNGTGPNPPAAPSNVAVEVRFDSITVIWTEGSNATSHRVVLSATGEADRTVDPASGGETGFSGLTSGVTYTATVTAVNAGGETDGPTADGTIAADMQVVRGSITSDQTWTSSTTYVLQGPVFVGEDGANNSVLTVEPGTTILGDPDPPGGERGSYLVITRGSQIIADANANRAMAEQNDRPNADDMIVFTSANPRGSRARGDWGGLVINGYAPLNSGPEAEGEGESGLYGGTDPMDDSGILRGVRVEFAGDNATATDQLNGIAFQGVGAGTTVMFVQVHYNQDDGTEPFGGTVTQTYMVVTGIGDDSFDGTDGYKGFMQFLIAQQRADDADNGFEISNNADTEDASPHSTSIIANATMIGAGVSVGSGEIAALGASGDVGVTLREGSSYRVFNTIFSGFDDGGFCVEGGVAAQNADNWLTAASADPNETLRFESNVLWANVDAATPDSDLNFAACGSGGYTDAENKAFFEDAGFNNLLADPNLPDAAFDVGDMSSPPNFIPTALPGGYTAFDASTLNNDGEIVLPADGRTLEATSYPGALEPGIALMDAWYYGWTVWDPTGLDSRPNHEGN